MTTIIFVLTLVCIAMPIYVYAGYPVVLFTLSKIIKRKRVKKATIEPQVTVLVSCFNEVDVVRQKIQNCLELDYPKDRLEIIFISDGTDDGTDDVVKEFETEGIKLIRQEGRKGKTSALNLAVPIAKGEIIVFSDANAIYNQDAIFHLVNNFSDPDVGYVVGAALYSDGDAGSASASEDAYWKYEVFLKTIESYLHSVVGGDGAIYAIRKELYETLDAKDINDFVNPLQIIAKGYRGVFDAQAICYEETAGDFDKEASRKKRIVNRSFRGLMKVKATMNPLKVGFFSFEVISHKLLRWLIPFFLLGAGLGTIYLSIDGYIFFQVMALLGLVFCWLAVFGYLKSNSSKVSSIFYYPYYFILVNFSSMMGVIQALKGDIQVTWSSPRAQTENRTRVGVKSLSIIAVLLCASMYLLQNMFSIGFF